jgi:hypothetical protein
MTCCSFNATLMLEMLRGKRMLFVGDTLNRGQYVSLICMLHRAIPDGAKSFESVDALSIFRAKVYVTFLSALVLLCVLSLTSEEGSLLAHRSSHGARTTTRRSSSTGRRCSRSPAPTTAWSADSRTGSSAARPWTSTRGSGGAPTSWSSTPTSGGWRGRRSRSCKSLTPPAVCRLLQF